MARFRILVLTLMLLGTVTQGAKRGNVACKNCKHKIGHHNRLIASPINLLNPDRYEFFTLDDKGKVIKRIMTFKEIQSIVAGSDTGDLKLFANKNNNDRIVSSVVSNVRNVLNNELNLMHGHENGENMELPISEVINLPDEQIHTSTEQVLDKYNDNVTEAIVDSVTSATTTRTTVATVEKITEKPVAILPTEDLSTRWMLKTTQKPPESTLQQTRERTTESTTISPMISTTERAAVRSTFQPTETSTVQQTTTVRYAERSTTEHTIGRPTSAALTTQQPMTEKTTVRMAQKPAVTSTERSTEKTTTIEPLKPSTDRRSPTTARPMEAPMLKLAGTSMATLRSTEAPLLQLNDLSTTTTPRPTESSTTRATEALTSSVRTTQAPTFKPIEMAVLKTTVRPIIQETEESSEHTIKYSTHNVEETSANGSSMEYSTEESSEKWNDESSETAFTSEETSTEGSTEVLIITSTEVIAQPSTKATIEKVTIKPTEQSTLLMEVITESVSNPVPLNSKISEQVFLKDVGPVEPSDELDSNSGLITLFTDPVIQYVTTAHTVESSVAETNEVDEQQETTTLRLGGMDPTTASLEINSSTSDDFYGNSSEQESEEMELSTLNIANQHPTTLSDVESTPLATDPTQSTVQDTSTIHSDAQHAIHKIIESLQSLNDDSGSDESADDDESDESPYTVEMPGMSYDTDAQSSINAIIQSLGQDTLSNADSSSFTVTTDTVATTGGEYTTVPHAAVKIQAPISSTTTKESPTTGSSSTTLRPGAETSVASTSSETPTSGIFNYNTNIMDTIEKFLSKFASIPSEKTYSVNLTRMNILSGYPDKINMTDYVDRTATVASVLKFPQTKPVETDRTVSSEEQLSADSSTDQEALLADEPILSETVASFMKLGEMLTMGNSISSAEVPVTAKLELKTVADEEETELLRFLSICSNIGTNMYGYLTEALANQSRSERSMVYSPFATITTLSMLFLGTRGASAESINGVIGLDEMTSFNPHLFFKSIAEDLKPKQRRTSPAIGNDEERESSFMRTLLSDEFRGGLQRFFKARIQEIYSTVAETIDFRQKDQLLKHLSLDFPNDYLDILKELRSPLVSISRNRYRHECNDAASYGTMDFEQITKRANGSVTVPSVTFQSGFATGYTKALEATILALPGSTSNVSVFFLKPANPAGLADLESHFRTQGISNVLKLFPDETVRTAYAEVQLPYFTQTTIYNMTQSVQNLGLQNLFEPNVANFNGLQDSAMSNLYLSEIIQSDSFALCGNGDMAGRTLPVGGISTNLVGHVEHSSQTNDVPSDDGMLKSNRRRLLHRNRSMVGLPISQGSKLVFDTPFLYLVRHNPTGMILYMGRFVGNTSE